MTLSLRSTKLKGVRIGYMGYLTLLAEEVISALDRFPEDLSTQITSSYAPRPEWEEYIKGRYSETKKKDRVDLGGPNPSLSSGFDGGGVGGGFGLDGEPGVTGHGAGAKASFAGAGTGIGTGIGAGASGAMRMMVDEAAMFSGLRLDETNAATFAPRTSVRPASSRIEIVQEDIEEVGEEGGRVINVGGLDRKADVPEDIRSSSRYVPGIEYNIGEGGHGERSGVERSKGEFRRVNFGGRSRSGRSVVARIRNTAGFGPGDDEDEDEDRDERTTHVSS